MECRDIPAASNVITFWIPPGTVVVTRKMELHTSVARKVDGGATGQTLTVVPIGSLAPPSAVPMGCEVRPHLGCARKVGSDTTSQRFTVMPDWSAVRHSEIIYLSISMHQQWDEMILEDGKSAYRRERVTRWVPYAMDEGMAVIMMTRCKELMPWLVLSGEVCGDLVRHSQHRRMEQSMCPLLLAWWWPSMVFLCDVCRLPRGTQYVGGHTCANQRSDSLETQRWRLLTQSSIYRRCQWT
jgi:hypothetical protein